MSDREPIDLERLLAHLAVVDTLWFKASSVLLDFGRRNVPEHRDSRNPGKWAAAELGRWMSDRQHAKVNRRLDQ